MKITNNLVIIGVGLIGGSLALAAKKKRLAKKVIGVFRSRSSLEQALKQKLVDEGTLDLEKAVSEADLIVLGSPVSAILPLAKTIARYKKPEAIVTDVASTKLNIVKNCEKLFGPFYVGAHPMAGSEKSGSQYADPALFQHSVCLLTPTKKTGAKTTQAVRQLWQEVGAVVKYVTPEEHDQIVARVSHLPHLLAFSLMLSLSENRSSQKEVSRYIGNGFRDMSRIAASNPALWNDIFYDNSALPGALDRFINLLKEWKQLIAKKQKSKTLRLLTKAKTARDQISCTRRQKLKK